MTHVHFPLAATQVEQKVEPKLGKGSQAEGRDGAVLTLARFFVLFRQVWNVGELAQGVRVAIRRLFHATLSVENIPVFQQFVEQDQLYVGLIRGDRPSRRAQLCTAPQKALHHENVSTVDGAVQRSHTLKVDVLHHGPFLQQQFDQFWIALWKKT